MGSVRVARPEQHRKQQGLPGWRLPAAVEPAAPGALVVSDDHEPLGRPLERFFQQDRVRRGGLGQLQHIREPGTGEQLEPVIIERPAV